MTASDSQAWQRLALQIFISVLLSAVAAGMSAIYTAGEFSSHLENLDSRVKILERNDNGKGVVLTDHTSQLTGIQGRISSNNAMIQQVRSDLKEDIKEMKHDLNTRLDIIIKFLQRENDLRKLPE